MTAYTIKWHDDSRKILTVTMKENWQWQDALESVHEQISMLRTVPQNTVYSIFDFSGAPDLPEGAAIPNLSELITHRASNHGLTIFVGSAPVFNMLMASTKKIFDYERIFKSYHFVDDLPSALKLIKDTTDLII